MSIVLLYQFLRRKNSTQGSKVLYCGMITLITLNKSLNVNLQQNFWKTSDAKHTLICTSRK